MESDITKKPKGNAFDVVYHALKVALGAASQAASLAAGIPLSVPVSDFMSALFDPPGAKRRDE